MSDPAVTLVVRKTIAASPERLFAAWTEPDELRRWWGPDGVSCIDAAIDLRVGGGYRIGNRLPDGTALWIAGEFEVVDRPHRLVYTWRLEGRAGDVERVTVQFERRGGDTEVIVTHARVATAALGEQHQLGWEGCLAGLARHVRPAGG